MEDNKFDNADLNALFSSLSKLFSNRLKEVIAKKNINITRLAAQLYLTTVTIYKYQNGQTYPSNILEKIIAHALQIDPCYFYLEEIDFDEASRLYQLKKKTTSQRDKNEDEQDQKLNDLNLVEEISPIQKKAIALIKKMDDDQVKKIIKMIPIISTTDKQL